MYNLQRKQSEAKGAGSTAAEEQI
uniref:Uncharacterized protein n=1 Tax=Arundo donax TaxID=35708 RepID=A0A0A9GHA3_ARUDO